MSIRVLVADKSNDIESIIKAITKDHKFKVVAKAKSGLDIISYCSKSKIDVVVMTTRLEMETDQIIKRLMDRTPTPILILQDTYDTTQYGMDYNFGLIDKILVNFNKGGIVLNEASMQTRIHILSKIDMGKLQEKLYSKTAKRPQNLKRVFQKINKPVEKITPEKLVAPLPKEKKLVVIGASTGGPRLLSKLIPHIPVNFPPVIIVQHIPVGFIEGFAKRMEKVSRIKVKMATQGEVIQNGTVYIAPGGYHLKLNPRGSMLPRIDLIDGEPVNFVKPSVDVTLNSAVEIYGENVVSVILTGMGVDGLNGSINVKKVGGKVVALNKEDADIYGMNKAVIDAGITDMILPASDIVKGIISALRGR